MDMKDDSEVLIETLTSRGWCFRDLEEIKTTIMIQSAILGDTCTPDSLESELANMDLRSVGAKSLPELSVLRKSSHLVGPKVLQISSVRDISRSSIENCSGDSHSRRLLKLSLTDGHSEVTAVEYTSIPSIPDDVVPGTKVCLQSKASIRNGILCLNPKVITVLGGVVQSLYDEWQMNKKYSTLSHPTLRLSKQSDGDGPPPFEKFQVERNSHKLAQQDYSGPTSRPTFGPSRSSKVTPMGKLQSLDLKDHADDMKKVCTSEKTEEKPSTSDTRPKEVVDIIPVQNQAASQKLLQKMAVPKGGYGHSRGGKYERRARQEELPTLTLGEYEKGKYVSKSEIGAGYSDINRDEDFARQLQNQFNLENHVERDPHEADVKNIKMSMFNFEQYGERDHGGEHYRGRGGRGRGNRGGGRRGSGRRRERRFD